MHDLADGSADVALGGLWVPAMYAGNGRDFVAVAQLNDRFPMAIVTRDPVEDFTLSWLLGKTVLAPGQGGGAPGEFTRGLMREAGLRAVPGPVYPRPVDADVPRIVRGRSG